MGQFIYGQCIKWDTVRESANGTLCKFPRSAGETLDVPKRVKSFITHDSKHVLGTDAVLWADESGLWFQIEVTNDCGRRAADRIRSGQMNCSSVDFTGASNTQVIDGQIVQVLTNIKEIREAGPFEGGVTHPSSVFVSSVSMAPPENRRNLLFAKYKARVDAENKLKAAEALDREEVLRQREQQEQVVRERVLQLREQLDRCAHRPPRPFRRTQFQHNHQTPQAYAGSNPLQAVVNNSADGIEVLLYGVVGDPVDACDAQTLAGIIARNSAKPITLRINSPGGSFFDGLAIMNVLRQHRAKSTAIVEGLAASAATVAACGCDEILMMKHSTWHVHESLIAAFGHVADLKDAVEWLKNCNAQLESIYVERTGRAVKDIRTIMLGKYGDGTVYDAEQAREFGFIDRIISGSDSAKSRRAAARAESTRVRQAQQNFADAKRQLSAMVNRQPVAMGAR